MPTELKHHGVKGQRWGVRKDGSAGSSHKATPSEDVEQVNAASAKIKAAGGTHVLSNKELQTVVTRMNLEQNYSRLVGAQATTVDKGQSTVKKILAVGATVNAVIAFSKSPAGQAIKAALNANKTYGDVLA